MPVHASAVRSDKPHDKDIIQNTDNIFFIIFYFDNPHFTPIINVALSSYYKGTGLEEVLKKLEEYLDSADKNESDITNI